MSRNDYIAPGNDLARLPAVPRSFSDASRTEFLSALGMDHNVDADRKLWLRMKDDALRGHNNICNSATNLVPYLQKNIPPQPWTVTQITELALLEEARRLYNESRGTLRAVYNHGGCAESADGDMWVVRWMLWQVFLSGGYAELPAEEEQEQGNWGPTASEEHRGPVPSGSRRTSTGPCRYIAADTTDVLMDVKVVVNTPTPGPVNGGKFWDPARDIS